MNHDLRGQIRTIFRSSRSFSEMQADEFSIGEGRSRLAAQTAIESSAAAKEDSQQQRSAGKNRGQTDDSEEELGGLGDLADVALRMVPGHVCAVVDIREEPMRCISRKRAAAHDQQR